MVIKCVGARVDASNPQRRETRAGFLPFWVDNRGLKYPCTRSRLSRTSLLCVQYSIKSVQIRHIEKNRKTYIFTNSTYSRILNYKGDWPRVYQLPLKASFLHVTPPRAKQRHTLSGIHTSTRQYLPTSAPKE